MKKKKTKGEKLKDEYKSEGDCGVICLLVFVIPFMWYKLLQLSSNFIYEITVEKYKQ